MQNMINPNTIRIKQEINYIPGSASGSCRPVNAYIRFEGPLEPGAPPRPLPRPAGAGIPRPVGRGATEGEDEPATDPVGWAEPPEPPLYGHSLTI